MRYSEMKALENARDWQQAREAARLAPPSQIHWGWFLLAGACAVAVLI